MLGFGINAKFPQLFVQGAHKLFNARFDVAVVVVGKLLRLGRLYAKDGSAAVHKVGTLFAKLFIDKKIFLLGAHRSRYVFWLFAQNLKHPCRAVFYQLKRAQKGRFFIERGARIRAKNGGNTKGVVLNKRVRGGVPGGITARLEGGAKTAGRKRRSVALAFNKLFCRKLHNGVSAFIET